MTDNVLTVTSLTKSIKQLLESGFPSIWVEGEISNYVNHSSGHRYFTLKDEGAQIKCVIWKGMSRYLFFEPQNGMKVKACGQVTVYEKSGQYQLNVSNMQPAGIGALEIAFQQLKIKLEKEGLFDSEHKRPLPEYPRKVGIVTSPTGAAVRDIINIINRRAPWVELIIRPALVQGDGAAADIVKAIEEFNEYAQVDLLIVGRGGGSLEDLWPFNEEVVARAIYNSNIPIISAVGHQIDFTIADFVADLRAPTPSAAAEIAVPDGGELKGYFSDTFKRICAAQMGNIQSNQERLLGLVSRYGIRRPLEIINARVQRLDDLYQHFDKSAVHMVDQFINRLALINARLESASPKNIMNRGYAFVSSAKTGETIKAFTQVAVGDDIYVRLFKGSLSAKISRVRGEN
jgi:exodeoxyribonuclease VII large subunit